MPTRPLVLVHGYSADERAFDRWTEILHGAGYAAAELHQVRYESLADEVTLGDLAEGFERAVRLEPGLGPDAEFDALVHSTGMLVLRAWLTARPERCERLKHLVGLAPATFGSPLAHKGRGMLAALFRGNRRIGPDFLESGDRILRALELGGRATWELAQRDLVGASPLYGATRTTPWAFVFCGVEGYPFPLSLVNAPGTDGTVRLAGAALDSRKFTLDLTRAARGTKRATVADWAEAGTPVIPVEGVHHGSILHDPPEDLVDLVLEALAVDSRATFGAWRERALEHRQHVLTRRADELRPWQQFVFRVLDERGDPVPDYFIEFLTRDDDGNADAWRPVHEVFRDFDYDVHVFGDDPSLRCFHVDLASADLRGRAVGLRLVARSGSDLVGYQGYRQELEIASLLDGLLDQGIAVGADPVPSEPNDDAPWDGVIDLTAIRRDVTFFYPLTTTLVEIRLDREPLPPRGYNRLVRFPRGRGRSGQPELFDPEG